MSLNLTIFGAVGLLLGVGVVLGTADVRLPANNRGYEPVQPIAFSHRLHAGDMAIDCQFCHHGARRSRVAGVPSADVCMKCHRTVTASFAEMLAEREQAVAEEREERVVVSAELRKLYDALALDADLNPDPERSPAPIEWVRVHNLPDFVWFDHRPHVARGVACESCHGPVRTMDRMRQESDLSMGWCIRCHRANAVDPLAPPADAAGERVVDHVSTNCVTCHL